jgi:hypothetical protein
MHVRRRILVYDLIIDRKWTPTAPGGQALASSRQWRARQWRAGQSGGDLRRVHAVNRSSDKDRRRRNRLAKRRQHPQERAAFEDEVLSEIADLLATGEPLDLLGQASTYLYVMDEGNLAERAPEVAAEGLTRTNFLASLIDIDRRETTALLTAWRWLTPSAFETRMIATALAQRKHPLPSWLSTLGDVRLSGVALIADDFGDGDGYLIELRWPDATVVTLVTLLDANLGYALADAFTSPEPIDSIEAAADAAGATRVLEADPADTRARIAAGIAHSAVLSPQIESDTWPMMRPLLEWALRMMPAGGRDYPVPKFDEQEAHRIAEDFAASLDADSHERAVAASVAEQLVWFAQFNCGDPFRWSPAKVDQLMTDWWARKVRTTPDIDLAMPDVLAQFVTYCADRLGLSKTSRRMILDTIKECLPDYLKAIRSPRDDTASLLAKLAASLPIAGPSGGGDPLDLLAARIGGRDVLDSLDAEPLPLDDFDWTGIPPQAIPKVGGALTILDDQAETHFDAEFGAACRRVLARLASFQPELFTRKASDATAACAIAYLVADTNNLIGSHAFTGVALAKLFGVNAMPTSRVQTFRTTLLQSGRRGHRGIVTEPGLLTSDSRRQLIEIRDVWADAGRP